MPTLEMRAVASDWKLKVSRVVFSALAPLVRLSPTPPRWVPLAQGLTDFATGKTGKLAVRIQG